MTQSTFKYKGGSLSDEGDIRVLPKIAKASTPNPIAPDSRVCYIMHNKVDMIDQTEFNIALGYHISRFYASEEVAYPDGKEMMIAAAGIAATLSNWNDIAPWATMVTAMLTASLDIQFVPMDSGAFCTMSANDPRYVYFLNKFAPTISDNMLRVSNTMLCLGSCILLAMGKNLDSNNYNGWMRNRIRGFSGTVGEPLVIDYLPESMYPVFKLMNAYSSSLSAHFEVRRELFMRCLSLADSTIRTVVTSAMTELVHMLRGTEMTHIMQIDKYLFRKYRELLKTKMLSDTIEKFAGAIQYLKSLPDGVRMYARLLFPKADSAMLNRGRFELAAAAATACAQFENSTFKNYYTSDNAQVKIITEKVITYLTQRSRFFGLSAGDHDMDNMGINEKEKYFNLARKIVDEESVTTPENDFGHLIMPANYAL